jgi:arylsulfatase A-like enzyme
MATGTYKNGSTITAPVFIWLGVVLLGIVASAGIYFVKKPSASAAPRPHTSLPNIVFIIADDIGWNDYGFNQHPYIQTPNIDKLAQEGVLFNNGYASNSICRPSLASIITGLYPSQHGITANARVINQRRGEYDIGLPPYAKRMNSLDTLPRELSKLGYRSYQAGKWWEEGYGNGGFDDGDKKPQGLFRHVTRTNVIGREGLQPIFDFIDNNNRDKNRQQPFFIWYAPQMPHTPHNPPPAFLNRYLDKTTNINIAKYWGMVSWFDNTIGQIVAHLETQGLRDNTLIVYMADNGVSLQDEMQNAGSSDGKDSPYEMGNRTPIIFNWPSHWPPAQRAALISTVDVFPTVMDLLQQPARQLSGVSVLPGITAGTPPAREFVVGEGFPDPGKEVFDSPRKFRWIRFEKWKLISYADQRVELFDLNADPGEQHNLSAEPAMSSIKSVLLDKLDKTL